MNHKKQNLIEGNRNDVAISYQDYLELVECVYDEKLSAEMMMRFKNISQINAMGIAFTPIFCFPLAYLLNYAIIGPVRRGHSGYRPFWMLTSITLPITCWFGYTVPIPRRLYTDILASNDADSAYVRQAIKLAKPGLWRKISRELYDKKWSLPEMNEYQNGTEFPLDFVNPHNF